MSPDPFHAVQERDRALPRRRGADLDLRRRDVALARGGPDRPRARDHRQAGRAPRGRAGPPRPSPPPSPRRGESLMESATVALGHGHDEHHGPPEANQSSRIDRQTLGILLFIVSEVMLFGAFFAAYFFLRVVVDPPSLAAGSLRAAGRGRRGQHGDPRLLELHDPLRAGVDPARQPHRASNSAWSSPGCSARPSSSSRSTSTPTSASAPATSASARSSTASPACTAPTSSSA